jgi:hypothetical protein
LASGDDSGQIFPKRCRLGEFFLYPNATLPCETAAMRTKLILVSGAVAFGLAGGYAWSAMTAPLPRPPVAGKAGFAPLPASPEERPAELDQEWTERSDDVSSIPAAQAGPVHYWGCNEVRAAGKAPLNVGDPGYSEGMDGDHDGIACEPIRNR